MLDALEGKLLYSHVVSATLALPCNPSFRDRDGIIEAYLELGDNVGGAEVGRLLKGEHGVVALYVHAC